MKTVRIHYIINALATVALLVAAMLVQGAQSPAPVVPQNAAGISGPERYLTHISTDKPIYRTGERLYIRGVVLRADGHTPKPASGNAAINSDRTAYIEIKGPKGDTVSSGYSQITDSSLGFAWNIPTSQAGGEYTVIVSHPFTGDAPAQRKFDIRAYRPPRLKSQIVFFRDGYGPGDTVTASLHVERAEGGLPVGAKVSIAARVDSADVWNGQGAVDSSGNVGASFKLPSNIARGEGVLAMVIQDGGTVETATKTIPILLQTLDLKIYPEGGDLVAGLMNRVYVEGRTPAQKPADMAGVIEDSAGRDVARFRTEHEGRGRFSFTPARGERYSLRVTEPAGIKTVFPLPSVKDSGAVITSTSDVIARQEDVSIRLAATSSGAYDVVLTQRGREIASKLVRLRANQPVEVSFTVPRALDGVLIATVYDERQTPLTERLLFRQPARNLKVQVVADKSDFIPGDKVTLRVTTTDERGKPMGGVVGLTVTDSSVLEMIEKREQAPRLPVMVLLESDVRELADAHVYLDEMNPKAELATDLLLGTQGWRRFAVVDGEKFVARNGDAGRRALGMRLLTDSDKARMAQFGQGIGGGIGIGVGQGVGPGAPNAVVMDNIAMMKMVVPPVAAPPPPPPPARPDDKIEARQAQERLEDRAFKEVAAAPPVGNVGRGGGAGGGILAGNLVAQARIRNDFTIVREYAHALRPNWTEGSRIDFAETVYWNAGVKTDDSTGLATVSFNLSDSVTSFRVLADGFAQDGTIGSAVSHIESVQPFSIEPKVPLQVTSGDVIRLPIGMINGVSRDLSSAEILSRRVAGLEFSFPSDNGSTLRARERARRMVRIDVGRDFNGVADLTFEGKAGAYRDTVTRKLDVQPLGFPFETSKGGLIEPNGSQSFEITIPNETVRGSITSNVVVYPTPLATMTEALQALLRQPNGCFEQTSSTSYPLVMAQQYFLTHNGIDPGVIEKARVLLEASYKKLTGFESKTKGYEWFGADPGHEALTAYGLMQFTDMSVVRDVDREMVQRTRDWLLARRDGSGGFSKNAKALDTFGRAPDSTTNAYITWALVEAGQRGLEKEIAAVKASANSSEDSYVIALASNILHITGDRAGARLLMDKLVKAQDAPGNVKSAVTSITRSSGDALNIETTALAVLAWLREPSYVQNVERGLKWIVESNKNGRFGSTQSTILALRSIIAYDAARAHPKAPGRMILTVDGRPVGTPVAFSADTKGALLLPEFGRDLAPGKHTIALKMEQGSEMPFSMSVKYHSTLPDSAAQAKVGIQVTLKNADIREGSVTEAAVSITNKSDEAVPTPVAIVGIPGGLEVRHDQLKELVKSGKIDAYEVLGREVVLYWRFLKAEDKVDIPISLVAAIPGSYTGPASRAYLYYTDELKQWAPGVKVTISPR